jgi:hypothetical protein
MLDAGGHSGRRPYEAVRDENPVGLDLDARVTSLQRLNSPPMRRRAPSIE